MMPILKLSPKGKDTVFVVLVLIAIALSIRYAKDFSIEREKSTPKKNEAVKTAVVSTKSAGSDNSISMNEIVHNKPRKIEVDRITMEKKNSEPENNDAWIDPIDDEDRKITKGILKDVIEKGGNRQMPQVDPDSILAQYRSPGKIEEKHSTPDNQSLTLEQAEKINNIHLEVWEILKEK